MIQSTRSNIGIALFCTLTTLSAEPTAVTLGKGSYASEPPNPNPQAVAFLKGPDRLDPSLGNIPYPSNDIWSFGIWSNEKEKFAFGRPYLMPLAVAQTNAGFEVYLTNAFNQPLGKQALGAPLQVSACGADGSALAFPAKAQRLLRFGDWSMSFRFRVDEKTFVDLTTVRGMPLVWLEPVAEIGLRVPAVGAKITALDGQQPLAASATSAILTVGDRRFALYVGGKGSLKAEGEAILVTPGAPLAIAALLPEHDATSWRSAAMSIPRDTRVDWNYNRATGMMDTVWTIKTDKLAPDAGPSLQGWLPHCWRKAMDSSVKFLDTPFLTPRGKIKLTRGDSFKLSWRVTGLLPAMPPPATNEKEAPFDPARLNERLATYASDLTGLDANGKSKLKYRDDTYFGAKDMLKYAQMGAIANFNKSPSRDALVGASREVLSDWFTWTPGESARYWARYEKLGAFVGFKSSFNANEFRDTHFHCGYYTHAAAIQIASDPTFAADFGEFATLIAKQYANWDRSDKRFPFFRAFDLWSGQSFASAKGNVSGDSANQESSSEAMNAWAGLGLLGAALQKPDMEAAGLLGYAIEGEAVKEYWNNYYGWKAEQEKPGSGLELGNWGSSYRNTIVGIVSQGGNRYGTFFSGSPHHIYGIQWLPISPALQYLSYGDPKFGTYQFDSLKKLKQGFDLETSGDSKGGEGWSDVFAGYLAIVDPVNTAKRWEALWDAKSPIALANSNTLSYYLIHAYRSVGILDPRAWTNIGTASVFQKADGNRSLVAWNPSDKPLVVTASDTGGVIGSVTVAPGAISRAALQPKTK